ncbi:MAG: TerC family protein [Planctomycetes bacterium]|nr:TerC family protein [Planctomycetota bacterium]MBI3843852.1 TerC family protein [Planctomycetota bacterium]
MGHPSSGSPIFWAAFITIVVALLVVDLGIFHRRAHVVRIREAALGCAVWVSLALAFDLWVAREFGKDKALEFLTGYVIEYALSIDNIFVFIIIFSYFSVPHQLHHRVLFWGILGAIVLRATFILAGTAILHQFVWVFYVFGAFLVFTGVKLLLAKHEEVHPERNPALRLFRRFVPLHSDYDGQRFVTVQAGRRLATPLLLVLVVVEASDVLFAVDSIPAIFAITTDSFIVFTSNIFAILGLRALYFVVSGMMNRFQHLKIGLGLVLAFVGGKMLVVDFVRVSIGISLAIVGALIVGSVVASFVLRPDEPPIPVHEHEGHPAPPFTNESDDSEETKRGIESD